jgi:hypothetical protein
MITDARRTRERGATYVEYLAGLLVIAGIAGTLVTSGLGERVYAACAAAVCRVAGGACALGEAGEPAAAGSPRAGGGGGGGAGGRYGRSVPMPVRTGAPAPVHPPVTPPACGPNPNGSWTEGLHSHNDYQNRHSLTDALDHGATSVEIDVRFNDKGELVLQHGKEKPRETLGDYVERLRKHAEKNGGQVYPGRDQPFEVYIEVKQIGDSPEDDAREAEAYAKTLEEIKKLPPGVRVVMDPSGLPPGSVENAPPNVSFAFTPGEGCTIPPRLDPRSDQYDPGYAKKFTMFNGSYEGCADRNGDGEVDKNEQRQFNEAVRRAHEAGYKVRVVEGPDGTERNDKRPGRFKGCSIFKRGECGAGARRDWWRSQKEAGVDYLDTQHLTTGQKWIRSCGKDD